jgi:hypothetical protein
MDDALVARMKQKHVYIAEPQRISGRGIAAGQRMVLTT